MTVRLNPYISFQGETREAMDFYRSVFGGELTVSTYGESGMTDDAAQADKVMHAQLDAGSQISISLSGDDEATLRRYWDGLVEGGSVTMPLERAPWGDSFGMCADRFGVNWMVNIAGAPAGAS